ncbi:MAG: hypothetical protein MUR51_00010 [Pseudomonadota bacterium]|nr:hypothetical protein [Pseudomonadota bacterium]
MTKKVIILPLVLIILAVASYIFLQKSAVVDESKIKLYGNVDIREAQLSFNSSEHIK